MDRFKGFTLVEMTVVIGVFIAVFAVLLPFSIQNMNINKAENSAKLIMAKIFTQQQNAYTQMNDFPYGIEFETSSLKIYRAYSSDNYESFETINLENGITIKNISLNGGGNRVYFEKGTVRPSYYGTISVGDPNNTYIIDVNSEGLITYFRQ